MHSISDERNWLTWLVKVRILILMVLLAIELAVIRLTPSPLPVLPFLTGMVLWFVLSLFFLFLVSVWNETPPAGDSPGARRSRHGHAGRPCRPAASTAP